MNETKKRPAKVWKTLCQIAWFFGSVANASDSSADNRLASCRALTEDLKKSMPVALDDVSSVVGVDCSSEPRTTINYRVRTARTEKFSTRTERARFKGGVANSFCNKAESRALLGVFDVSYHYEGPNREYLGSFPIVCGHISKQECGDWLGEFNKTLPMRADETTTIERVSCSENSGRTVLTYHYRLTYAAADFQSVPGGFSSLRDFFRTNFCKASSESLNSFNTAYSYVSVDGVNLGTFTFTSDDCPEIKKAWDDGNRLISTYETELRKTDVQRNTPVAGTQVGGGRGFVDDVVDLLDGAFKVLMIMGLGQARLDAQNAGMRQQRPPGQGISGTCFLKGEWASGMNRNCVYDCMGSESVRTQSLASICSPTAGF